MRFKRLLVTLDGSETAEASIDLADPFLRLADVRVDLLRVVPVVLREGRPLASDAVRASIDEADRYVHLTSKRLREATIDAHGHVRFGLPVEEILKFAAVEMPDLIVMTTHGRTGVRRWVVGSVTEQVLRAAPVPVLVRKSFDDSPAPRPGPIRTILVPLDGTDVAEAVVPYAAELARACRAEILVASAVPAVESIEVSGAVALTEVYIDRVRARLEREDVRSRSAVRRGEPAHEIRALIEREKPDLVAMSTHGRAGVSRWILGSVVESVLRSVTTPMFVYRVPPERGEHDAAAQRRD